MHYKDQVKRSYNNMGLEGEFLQEGMINSRRSVSLGKRQTPSAPGWARRSAKKFCRRPNAWGLYDMHGNVAEWRRSAYGPYPYVENDGRNNDQVDERKRCVAVPDTAARSARHPPGAGETPAG